MIDAHIHLDQYDYLTLPEKIAQWQQAGVKQVIAVSTDLSSSYKTLELQLRFPHFVNACIGFHPEFSYPKSHDVIEFKQLLKDERSRITAIGEIGLPHYEPKQVDKLSFFTELLDELLLYAYRYELPVSLHAVHDKAATVLTLLKKHKIKQAHFHWFKGPHDVLSDIVNAQYYISVTPELCYRKRDQLLLHNVPLTQLLIETDGPWQYNDSFQKQETTPLMLKNIVDCIEQQLGGPKLNIARQIELNTKQCYLL
ncbi:TatD family hydrolase [Halalkalibacter hemicellulosilyticus]|uniref:Deoxyribonuclease n=1 Tax=Halalkalibacter hemicellulosilyticusJCM 9152 TaxID=1236971 RepID=W4QFZ8_9BACI|nr:TatD family hydrolase [Halalkalibacter hemicellulosilyticus]GAE30573.1 deoxyribonuclease [Halalkalibacter hemicellulosilyticusJCM 9152]